MDRCFGHSSAQRCPLAAVLIFVAPFLCGVTYAALDAPRGGMTISKEALSACEPNGIQVVVSPIRYRMGDDPAWKEPGLADNDWDVSDKFGYPSSGVSAEPPIPPIWFRFNLHFDPVLLGKPLVIQTYDRAEIIEIFMNGVRVADAQTVDVTKGVIPRCIVPLQTDYVVALRWIPDTRGLLRALRHNDSPVFRLYLREYAPVLDQQDQQGTQYRVLAVHRIILITAFAMFFLLHLTLYIQYPRRRENVFYGMTALFSGLALVSLHVSEIYRYDDAIWGASYMRCFFAFMPLSVLSGFGLFQLLLTGRIRWTLPVYLAFGIPAYIAAQWLGNVSVHWFPLLVIPELLWLIWTKYRKGGMSLGWSAVAVLVIASVALNAAGSLFGLNSDSGFVRYAAWYVFLFFLQGVAVAFIREYAEDKKRIEAFAISLEREVAARTQELESEISVRRKAEEGLKTYQDSLEELVRRRTEELVTKTSRLAEEILERERAEEAFQGISRRLSEVRDEERRRIARELHDSVAQELAAIVMNLGQIEDTLPQPPSDLCKLIAGTLALGQKCSQEVRTLSYLLYPPLLDQLGLAPAVRSYVDGFSKRSGMRVTVNFPPDFERMPAEIELALFRIMQECLGNIHRHAKSRTAHIRLEQDAEHVMLEVSDDGQGMPPDTLAAIQQGRPSGGVGIAGMQERMRLLNGTFSIESSSDGTTVRAMIPLGG